MTTFFATAPSRYSIWGTENSLIINGTIYQTVYGYFDLYLLPFIVFKCDIQTGQKINNNLINKIILPLKVNSLRHNGLYLRITNAVHIQSVPIQKDVLSHPSHFAVDIHTVPVPSQQHCHTEVYTAWCNEPEVFWPVSHVFVLVPSQCQTTVKRIKWSVGTYIIYRSMTNDLGVVAEWSKVLVHWPLIVWSPLTFGTYQLMSISWVLHVIFCIFHFIYNLGGLRAFRNPFNI